MPSDTEWRCWLVLSVVLLWGLIGLAIWDQIHWAPVASPEAALLRLQRTTRLTAAVSIGAVGFGAILVTRLVYGMSREHRDRGWDADTSRRP